jgi:ribosome biogenesis GTP-binding protein YsxC/EngB
MLALQTLSAPPTDPMQKAVMRWLPVIFTVLFGGFAASLVIYYVWSNFITVIQRYIVMRHTGVGTGIARDHQEGQRSRPPTMATRCACLGDKGAEKLDTRPMTGDLFTDDEIEAGHQLFAAETKFIKAWSIRRSAQGRPPEIAFAGRSNVGKSSLINALCNRKNLARASNTPGRTQEINFFDLSNGRLYLVDLPGYGFAEAPKKSVDAWSRFTLDYLRSRSKLKRVFVLIDGRRGLGEVDAGFLNQLDSCGGYQIVLTRSTS